MKNYKTTNNYSFMLSSDGKFHTAIGVDSKFTHIALPAHYAKLFAEMDTTKDKDNNQETFRWFVLQYFTLSNQDKKKFQALIDCEFLDSLLTRILDLVILVQRLNLFDYVENVSDFNSLGTNIPRNGIFHPNGNYYYYCENKN